MAEVKLSDLSEGVRTLYNKGIEALKRGNRDYAMDLFESALKQEPQFLEARKQLKTTSLSQNPVSSGHLSGLKRTAVLLKIAGLLKKNPAQALELSENLLRKDPLNMKIAKLEYDAALACDMPEVALLTLELINEKLPDQLIILEPLAEASKQAELFDREYEHRNRIVQLKPGDTKALKNLKDAAARLTMGKSGWKEAESFRNVIRKEAEQSSGTTNLQEAEDKVKAAPENKNFRLILANLHVQKKAYDSALTTLDEFLETTGSNDREITQKRGKILELQLNDRLADAEDRKDAEAVTSLRKELTGLQIRNAQELTERYPTDLQLKYDLGKLLFENGALTEAVHQFQLARENPQRRARSNLYIARAFLQKNQPDLAAEHFEAALNDLPAMNDTRKEILYELGLLHEKTGNRETATRFFKEIYTADISYRDVAEKVENTN